MTLELVNLINSWIWGLIGIALGFPILMTIAVALIVKIIFIISIPIVWLWGKK
jgi:hypothetical protein